MTIPYLEPARGENNQFWRYILTIVAVIMITFVVSVVLGIAAIFIEGDADIASYSPLTTLLISLLPFPLALLALWGGLRLFHRRGLMSLLHPGGSFGWSKVFFAGAVWFLLAAASDLVYWLINPSNYTWSFDPAAFFRFLIPLLVLIPIQTATEELIFRGYLTQWMGRFSQAIWLPLLLPSIFFMLMHIANPEVATYGALLTLPLYLSIGLLLSWVTLKSGGLEMALGIHAANNLYASLIVTFPSSALPTPALFSIQSFDPVVALVQQLAVIAVSLVIFYSAKKSWLVSGAPALPAEGETVPGV